MQSKNESTLAKCASKKNNGELDKNNADRTA